MQAATALEQYKAVEWVDPDCYYFSTLKLQDKSITATKPWTYVFGQHPITKQNPSFTVRFNKFTENVAMGMASKNYSKLQSFSAQSYSVQHYQDGRCYVADREYARKGGFKQNEPVTLSADFTAQKVTWKVGNQIRYQAGHITQLNDKVQWVPVIYLARSGDSISIY